MAASTATRLALVGGLVVAAALGGLYAARLTQPGAPPPQIAPAPIMPAPAVQAPPTPAPAAPVAALPSPPTSPSPDVPTLGFEAHVDRYSLARDDAAYVAASLQAPQLYPLARGTPVVSASRSVDGAWIIVLTEDGQAAYVPMAALGPFDPAANPLAAGAAAAPVLGDAEVLDTATLSVAGQQVALAGISGVAGELAGKLQQSIRSHGGAVQCVASSGGGYLCTLPDGVDVARLALFNGAARPGEDASADYRAQAEAARAARRGLWE